MGFYNQMTVWTEPERLVPFDNRGLTPKEELCAVIQARAIGEQLLDVAGRMLDDLKVSADPTVLAAFLASPVYELAGLGIRAGLETDELATQLTVLEDASLITRVPRVNGDELFELVNSQAA